MSANPNTLRTLEDLEIAISDSARNLLHHVEHPTLINWTILPDMHKEVHRENKLFWSQMVDLHGQQKPVASIFAKRLHVYL